MKFYVFKQIHLSYYTWLALATQQQIQGVQQIAAASGKPKVMDIQQQQQQQGKQSTGGQRPLSILPSSSLAVQAANIRAASSVSTQTVHGVQATVHVQVTIISVNSWKSDFNCCNFRIECKLWKLLSVFV